MEAEHTTQEDPGEQTFDLIVDLETRRPACVLLQAAYGCGENNFILGQIFDSSDWLVNHQSSFARVPGTLAQWRQLAANLKAKRLAS